MSTQRVRIVFTALLAIGDNCELAYGPTDADFDAFWSNFELTSLPAVRRLVGVALFSAVWISPLLIGRLPPLGRCDLITRVQALAAMADSRLYFLRQMLQLLKTIACCWYGADRRVRDAIGYPLQPDDPHRKTTP